MKENFTFDKTGKLINPGQDVHYEKQEEGFSISLDIDFGSSTQFAQPFSVLSVNQDGFTSGGLDGLEIDASGTIRQTIPMDKIIPRVRLLLRTLTTKTVLSKLETLRC